jgi:hypothetical protein
VRGGILISNERPKKEVEISVAIALNYYARYRLPQEVLLARLRYKFLG